MGKGVANTPYPANKIYKKIFIYETNIAILEISYASRKFEVCFVTTLFFRQR
jgi:hypothetical protein